MGLFNKRNSADHGRTAGNNPYAMDNAAAHDGLHGQPRTAGGMTGSPSGPSSQFTGGFGTGPTNAMGSQTNTAPAPLSGVHSTSHPSPAHGSSHVGPTSQEANKLDRKAKMESTVGGIFHNSNMKAKGQGHAAQADHLRMQASELSEAQRLEQEAGMRRQRAVGLGADPSLSSGTTGFGPNHRV